MNKKVLFSAFLLVICVIFIRFADISDKSVMTFSGNGDYKEKSVTLKDFANSVYSKSVAEN